MFDERAHMPFKTGTMRTVTMMPEHQLQYMYTISIRDYFTFEQFILTAISAQFNSKPIHADCQFLCILLSFRNSMSPFRILYNLGYY